MAPTGPDLAEHIAVGASYLTNQLVQGIYVIQHERMSVTD